LYGVGVELASELVDMQNRRQHFRIKYPGGERPRFVYESSISEVLECSERGIRLRPAGETPGLGQNVSGRIALCHGAQLNVAGKVIWSGEGTVSIHLDTDPIPFLAIIREQLYLRRVARQRAEAQRAATQPN
jgi:hypothetical protein